MSDRRVRPLALSLVLALVAAVLALLPAALATAGPAPASAPAPVEDSVFTTLRDLTLTGDRVRVAPTAFAAVRLDAGLARRELAGAPSQRAAAAGAAALRFGVPTPEGTEEVFEVVTDSVMEPALAARHPELTTYAGRSTVDPSRTIRMDLTPAGFHASVRDLDHNRAWYVDPAFNGRGVTEHVSYFARDLPRNEETYNEIGVNESAHAIAGEAAQRAAAGEVVTQRVYRMAWVTEPSYAKYFTDKGVDVLAEKVTVINRASHLYNDDMAIKFVLVNGSEKLNLDTLAKATGVNGPCGANACFAADDIESCGGDVLDRNKFVTGQIVGADNFDIGHFGSGAGSGGVAYLGVVGGADKAGGCTALDTPDGDFYAVDFFAHEVGHQMGGNHTFNGTNGSCAGINRNAETSVEPGSGSSVQAYAGICFNDDLQPHTDPYFSQRSIDEVTAVATAAPGLLAEQQVVNLKGLDAGDTFQLTFPGVAPVTITQGATYNAAGLQAAILTLTGKASTVTGYDGASAVGPEGFTVDFVGTADVQRLGIGTTTGGVTGFVGVLQNGGPETNGGTRVVTTNRAPTVVAPADKTIPVQTPFTLTGSGTDADAGTSLTYLWEQNDPGFNPLFGTLLGDNLKLDGPLFRVFGRYADVSLESSLESPSPGQNLADGNPSRTFPDVRQILAGTTNAETGTCPPPAGLPIDALGGDTLDCYSEFLPTAAYAQFSGALNFRLTARDGNPSGGGASFDDVTLTLDPAAGPFLVTSRGAADSEAAKAGEKEEITWDVAGTDAATLAPTVRISLSTDGGLTFPTVLAASTPNDGAEEITWPSVSTTKARIKVEAVGNYFFDLSDADFAITGGTMPPPPPGSTAPQTTITGGVAQNGFLVGDRTTVRYTSSTAGSTFRCALDGKALECGQAGVALTKLAPGMHRFAVAATSSTGAVDRTAATRLFSVPLSAKTLKRDAGWALKQDAKAHRGVYVTTRARGLELRYAVRRTTRVALVATTGPGFGRVEVFLDDRRIGRVSLDSDTLTRRVLIPIERFSPPRTGTITIRTLDGKQVRIEGLGVFLR
ncbi:M12 family metallo-peptidase [Nocardioides sp.]|uniref:M12 family metallo-peptidase n=1 Tax=Nocardioides sp. TaxID=35761 RepID=UPI00286A85B4|nr:M12 family metallo-peptidase [Nocardioides sp.]